MKKVRVILEAVVPEWQLKNEEDILEEYDSLNDAVDYDGLGAIIDGSYKYTAHCEILDV